jgi:hypothetical protein
MLRQTVRHLASPLPFPCFSQSYCDVSQVRSYFASTIHVTTFLYVSPTRLNHHQGRRMHPFGVENDKLQACCLPDDIMMLRQHLSSADSDTISEVIFTRAKKTYNETGIQCIITSRPHACSKLCISPSRWYAALSWWKLMPHLNICGCIQRAQVTPEVTAAHNTCR